MSDAVIPLQINSDPELIKAYVEGHWSWTQQQRYGNATGDALFAHRTAFLEGAITALSAVFTGGPESFPPQISPKWVRQVMLGQAARLHLPKPPAPPGQ
jgi:hypothetical protein